jgi:DNA helicase-2/ATP-dependent DNA helicase PcrA
MGRRMPKLQRESRLEKNLTLSEEEREKAGRVLRLKGSLAMMRKLETYLDHLQTAILPEKGFRMAGVPLMEHEELETVFLRDLRYFPLEQRISELKKIVRKRVQSAVTLLKDRYNASAEQMILKIRANMRESALRQQKIKDLYTVRDQRYREIDARAEDYLARYRDKFPLPDLPGLYKAFLQECFPGEALLPEDGSLRQEDLPMLVMICKALYGLKTKQMKHIVIDECQDFSPFQIELLKQANPAATFTLVGDLYQGIRADEGIRGWEEWSGPVVRGGADMAQLTVSYRNTVEIMNLAQTVSGRYPIPGICETRPVLRHGEKPDIIRTDNDRERLSRIREQVQSWRREGYHSIALIEKTAEQAKRLYRQIGQELDAHLLSETDAEYRGGVLILPASIVKGMEFDCVGICDASAVNYPDDAFICRILYVMMTRPLHRLSIWHKGDLTPLLS